MMKMMNTKGEIFWVNEHELTNAIRKGIKAINGYKQCKNTCLVEELRVVRQ